MKFSENWLREWVTPSLDVQQWSEKLTLAGLEVESITSLGADLNHVCIGRVLSVSPHPNADRLRICEVSINADEPALTIVCGASNVRSGLKVAVAQIGAVLPGNVRIKRSKIRGVESHGMLCSSAELGLADTTTHGIMELAEEAPLNLPLSDYLGLPDHILDINLTPNRGDCLSVAGLARELSAITNCPLTAVPYREVPATISATLPIAVQIPADCPRYIGRLIKGLNIQAVTPLWLQERLCRSNIRRIHPVVDIMNYVMIELGQPLHAFDLSMIQHGIHIRPSQPGENVTLLDGQTLVLEKTALVIADNEKILALGGIMGGASSAVSPTTTDILLESAFFTPDAVRPTCQDLCLQSDSSYRFERGVDYTLPLRAIHRASELVLSICGGQAGPCMEKSSLQHLPSPTQITLRTKRVNRILGTQLTPPQIEELLHRLELHTQPHPEGWLVTAPSYRFDLHMEIDLIEEIARLYGYENIPCQMMQSSLSPQPAPEMQLSLTRIRHFLMDNGYHECINYSFVDAQLAKLFADKHSALALSNPLSAELAVMRTSLWPGLLKSALYNLNRQQPRLRFFESGVCFLCEEESIQQLPRLAGIAIGAASPKQWGMSERKLDFFDIKGDLENLFALTHQDDWLFIAANHPALHPGRCAAIQRAGKHIGYMGELHPHLQQHFGLSLPVYLFELSLDELTPCSLPRYTMASKYPSIRRDLAFIMPATVPFQHIESAIRFYAGESLGDLQLFDIYQGPGIAANYKSLALSLNFQLPSRTLTDEEIDQVIQQIIAGLAERFQATLRDQHAR